jgi:hypothetical protein
MFFHLNYKSIAGIFLFSLLFGLLFVSQSCNRESDSFQGVDTLNINALLGVGQVSISINNIAFIDTVPFVCKFSILNKKGNVIYQDTSVSLTQLAVNNYISIPVNLNSGYYYLKTCVVYDADHNLLYQSNQQPGTIVFKIEKDKTTKIEPSLVAVPSIKVDSFYMYAYSFDVNQNNFVRTTGAFSLSSNGSVFYSGLLSSGVNSVLIPKELSYFIVNVTNPLFTSYRDSISTTDLSLYQKVYPYSIFLTK